jgi:general secretion pathway protein K
MNTRTSRQGSALLMVFWAVMVMSVCVLGLVDYLYSNMDETISLKKDSRAHQLAESGIAIALNPSVDRGDPVLKQTVAPGEAFEVNLHSEGGRLNINTVLQNREWAVLESLFTQWGVRETEAESLLDAFRHKAYPGLAADGAASAGGGQPPPQMAHLFESVDEMLAVPGMDLVAQAKLDWRDYFTIWSDGTLDMNDAPADLIMAVCGVGMKRAEEFMTARSGHDGGIFTSMEQVQAALALPPGGFANIQGLLSLRDSTSRIESTGSVGTFQRKITVVVRKSGGPPVYFQWEEL